MALAFHSMRYHSVKKMGQLPYRLLWVGRLWLTRKGRSAKRKIRRAVIRFLDPMNLCGIVLYSTLIMSPWLGIASIQNTEIHYAREPEIAPKTIKQRIIEVSAIHGVDSDVMLEIARREANIDLSTTTDTLKVDGDQKILKNGHGVCSNKKSPLYGKPADSRGLYQISKCWNPDISDEEAYSVDFAIEWTAKHIKEGRCYLWSTCPIKETTL